MTTSSNSASLADLRARAKKLALLSAAKSTSIAAHQVAIWAARESKQVSK